MRNIIVVLVLVVGCRSWSRLDVAMQASVTTLQMGDWYATETIAKPMCLEANPAIGRCGDGPVPTLVWFPVVMAANVLVAHLLPSRWRTAFQGASAGFQANTLLHYAAIDR